ncbi:MAG TPA: S1/P1 nuclease [Gemmataceae bacterium]|nr:S1/P1 nuclease [Gemmataceae bacterium]
MCSRLILTAVCILAWPWPAFAWHKDGHAAIGRIAWEQLKTDDPASLVVLTNILKAHPHYEVFLSVNPPDGIEVDAWAFAQAATWPDWVRDPKAQTPTLTAKESKAIKDKYHKRLWHFINLPLAHPLDQEFYTDAKLAEIRKSALEPELDADSQPRHAIAALKQSLATLKSADAMDKDKAVALCWILHLVGDLHQPLHASGLMARKSSLPATKFADLTDFDPPEGDAGGNRLAIKLHEKNKNAEVLHAYWDALVFKDAPKFANVEATLQKLWRKEFPRDGLPEAANKDFLAWADESLELAKTVVYRKDGTADSDFLDATPLPAGLSQDALNQALKDLTAPTLSPTYQDNATKTAKKRMALASYRLADQLRTAVGKS